MSIKMVTRSFLQYWAVSEEQAFRSDGSISTDPIGDISLVSPNLTIKAAHSEASMFGTRLMSSVNLCSDSLTKLHDRVGTIFILFLPVVMLH